MKQRVLKTLLIGVVVAAVALSMTGCPETLEIYIKVWADPYGYVLNTKTGDPIANATVKLTYLEGASEEDKPSSAYTTTTGSDGKFAFSDVVSAKYELTAELSGWAFVKQMVQISSGGAQLPNVGGFQPDSEYDISIITMWDPGFKDVDAYLTFPETDPVAAGGLAPTLQDTDFYSAANVNGAQTHFFPDTSSDRFKLYYGAQQYPTSVTKAEAYAVLDVDNRGRDTDQPGGPETITIRYIPVLSSATNTSYSSAGADDPSKLPAGDYTWHGTAEFYVNAYHATSSTAGTEDPDSYLSYAASGYSANVQVYLFQGSDQIGLYTVPTYTAVKTASIIRVNMFSENSDDTEWFQFLPDIRALADSSDIRSLSATPEIVVAGGRTAR